MYPRIHVGRVLSALSAVGLCLACSTDEAPHPVPRPVPVKVEPVTPAADVTLARYSGSIGKYGSGGNAARWSGGIGESEDRCMNRSFSARQSLMLSRYGTSFAVHAIVSINSTARVSLGASNERS